MIREERSEAFWIEVASHPEVRDTLMGLDPAEIAGLIANPAFLPLAAEHGGFLFCKLDGLGRVRELHTMFTPEGWGREVHQAAKQAFDHVFADGCEVVTTYEVGTNPRSQPPRSFGFLKAGEMAQSPIGPVATWVLTRAAWTTSPAYRRAH